MKIVLYINGKHGVWLGFEGNICVHLQAEQLHIEPSAYQPCAWIGSAPQMGHLVIDSTHAEVDAYPLQRAGTVLRQRSHVRALHKTLADRFADAIIRNPEKQAGLDAMLVQQLNLTEQARNWLTHIENSTLTFCSIATSAEILARIFALKNQVENQVNGQIKDQPYLVISDFLGYYKHTFCRSGHALFTRTLERDEKSAIAVGLAESLTHLRTTELIDQPVRVFSVGFAAQRLEPVSALDWIDEIEPVDLRKGAITVDENISGDELQQYGPVILVALHSLDRTFIRQQNAQRYQSEILAKYVQLCRRRRKGLQLAAMVALSVGSVCYSGYQQWKRQQQHDEFERSKLVLSTAIEQTKQAVLDQSPIGFVLADGLFNAAALRSSVGASPARLLTIVATVFTQHRQLVLHELNWVSVEVNSAADPAFEVEVVDQIASRTDISKPNTSVTKLVVLVAGYCDANATLREQQEAVNALADSFIQQGSISKLVVLEAPVMQAAKDDRADADALSVAAPFRIQFHLDRSLPSES